MTRPPKRPRDLNQWAKHMVDLATGAVTDSSTDQRKPVKNAAAVALGKLGGLKGGKARAKKLSRKELSLQGKMAATDQYFRSD